MTEMPSTIRIPVDTYVPRAEGAIPSFSTRDVIIALQDAGYLVYEASELPTVSPEGKLPSTYDPERHLKPKAQQLFIEAFEKLALARWHEQEAERRTKRASDLENDLRSILPMDARVVSEYLVGRGWLRG